MKLITDENRILISLSELVSIARRKISPTLPIDEDEPEGGKASRITLSMLGINESRRLSLDFDEDGVSYRVFGNADKVENGAITLVKVSTGSNQGAKKAEVAQARGEGFVLGKILAESEGLDSIVLKIIYVNEITGSTDTSEETVTKKALDSFFLL